MAASEIELLGALKGVIDPLTECDLVSGKQLKDLLISQDAIRFTVELGYPARSQWPVLRQALTAAVNRVDANLGVEISFRTKVIAHAVQQGVQLQAGVKNIIAVASGKGGVGKSTTATNLALAVAAEGATVGILDADIYGPSQPMMLGITGRPDSLDGKTMEPMRAHGIQLNSIGFMLEEDQPVIWRGPMATQALEQLLRQTNWQNVDYLFVDLPPGTGDIQMSLSQRVPLTGAVIVTTPQDIALIDAKRGLKMFEKMKVPVLGLIENMAVHVCSSCGHAEHIFGDHGGKKIACDYGIEHLGSLPLRRAIREQCDLGTPTVAAEPDSEVSCVYKAVARRITAKIAAQPKDYSAKFPTIVVSSGT